MTAFNPILKAQVLCSPVIVGFVATILLLPISQTSSAQFINRMWSGSAFIEEPDSSFDLQFASSGSELEQIVKELQPKKKKYRIEEDSAVVSMTYMVYEKAALGTRPFGRVRYNIVFAQGEGLLNCSFRDFTFKKIERNARYGKLEEVRGKPKEIASVKEELTDTQWGIVRWKTEGVINRKISNISSHGLQAMEKNEVDSFNR